MKLTPLHDWAVVRPLEAEEVTAGGLYIPDTAKEKSAEGTVEAIGPGAYEEKKYGKKKEEKKERTFIPTTVKPGDLVLYEKYAGQKYTIGKEERILVRERDILGILLEKPSRPQPKQNAPQIPAHTSSSGQTALSRPGTKAVVAAPGQKQEKAKAPAKKAAPKKAAKKAKKKGK